MICIHVECESCVMYIIIICMHVYVCVHTAVHTYIIYKYNIYIHFLDMYRIENRTQRTLVKNTSFPSTTTFVLPL